MDLNNKNALITGGVSGIGAAISEEFLQDGIKGVALIDIHSEEPEIIDQWRKKFPSQVIKYFNCDVADEDALKECYKTIIEEFKYIEIVVNCAGIVNETQFQKMININLTGLIVSSLLALDHMRIDRNGKGGFVVNISSTAGVDPFSLTPVYTATKHGVVGFTRCFMDDSYYEKMGVKFLALCPGATKTQILTKNSNFFFPGMEEYFAKSKDSFPILQEPSTVAKALTEVLSKEEPRGVWIIDNSQLKEHKFDSVNII